MFDALVILVQLGVTTSSPSPAAAPPAQSNVQQSPCTGPEHRQFDFWVGDWDVYPTGKDSLVAHSKIERLYNGCAIRENWMPLKGGGAGGSLNNYVKEDRRWRQTWVDGANSRVDFVGGLVGDKMVMVGDWKGVNGPGKDAIIRMTYSKAADGSVRQLGEQSTDHGLSWQPNFDFTYRPSKTN